MSRRRTMVIGMPFIVVGFWLHAQLRSHGQFEFDFIEAPSDWVAFDASFQKTSPNGKLTITGHYYRSSDGSTRDAWAVGGRGIVLIQIKNVPYSTYYVSRQENDGVWEQHPMDLPNTGYKPLLRARGNRDLAEISDKVEGLSLFRYSSPGSL